MQDILTVLTLVFLEGILSFDNALALAAMVRNLPPSQQAKALTYGMGGAFFFRFASLFFITALMQNPWTRGTGGAYLMLLALKYFTSDEENDHGVTPLSTSSFFKVVVAVELTDVAFSLDSILAAAAVSQKLPVILLGGVLGIMMMRFMASVFIRVMDSFPWLESVAYVIIFAVGNKLVLEALSLWPPKFFNLPF